MVSQVMSPGRSVCITSLAKPATKKKTADGAAAEQKTGTPSAKVPARTAARRSRDFLQEGSIDIKNFTIINNMIKTAAGAAPGLTAGNFDHASQ